MKKFQKQTDAELEILQILWRDGPSTVRSVNEFLNEKREVGYTTTLKLMQIMTEKSLVDRDTSARTHVYRALVEEGDVQKGLLKKVINTAFHGSASNLIMQALGDHRASAEELRAIKDLIREIETKSK